MSAFFSWQLADSAFPTGAFAHSWGLEAAWQHGEIPDVPALVRFAEATVLQTATGVLPLMNVAYRQPDRWEELDERAQAFMTCAVANRASRQQGRTFLATAARVWPGERMQARQQQGSRLWMHLGPVAGVVFQQLDVPVTTARELLVFGALRGVFTAAVRLGIVGSYEAQRLQYDSIPRMHELCGRAAHFDEDDLSLTSPIEDLFQAAHDRLYSRLFQS